MNSLQRLWCLAIVLFFWNSASSTRAQTTEYLPGLITRMTLADGSTAERVDATCDFQWDTPNQIDERLAPAPATKLACSGWLNVKAAGNYQLAIFVRGQCQVKLDQRAIIDGRSDLGALHKSTEQELSLGYHAFEIAFSNAQPAGQLQLYWRGPGFQWEPINERYLAHTAAQHPSDDFERGRLLARGLRCTACHSTANGSSPSPPLSAPELTTLKGNINREWLINWLTATKPALQSSEEFQDDEIARRMPHFGLERGAAIDIAAALFDSSQPLAAFKPSRDFEAKADKSKSKDKKPARTKPEAVEGRNLLLTRGCVACHAVTSEELGLRDEDDEANYAQQARQDYLTYQLFSGGDLSGIAGKRPDDFFSRWLANPAKINSFHRMPEAGLSDLEREDVSLYLATLKNNDTASADSPAGDAKRGAELIAKHRCVACHKLPEKLTAKPTMAPALTANSQWNSGCLQSANSSQAIPGLELTDGQRRALRSYWSQVSTVNNKPTAAPLAPPADLLMAESNCFGCHARHNHAGILPRAMQVIDQDRDLASRLPAMLPPSLNGVGDKLHEAALIGAIARTEQPLRPWLDVRMPKYRFAEQQVKALVAKLIASDRMPTIDENAKVPLADDVVTRSAAGRLVTSEGFGCQSCHKIGNQPSPTVALGARGTDLTMLGKRIRQSWFDRWVRNPIRIIPRMEMPAIQLPVHGVLGNDIHRQIDAVWEMLNTPEFQPPSPAPVRVVRKHNLPDQTEPAHVLTDVLETSSRNYLRPLIVGFQNRHNILFDLERGEIGKWWIGDTARELTRGKSWYWELGGQPLGAKLESLVRFELLDPQSERWQPQAIEQFVIDFDELDHTPSGVTIKSRMHFARGDKRLSVPLEIAMEPASKANWSGIEVSLRFSAPPDYQVAIAAGSVDSLWEESTRGPWLVVDEHTTINFPEWSKRHRFSTESGVRVAAESNREPVAFKISLWTTWPVDQFIEPVSTPATSSNRAIAINVVPGFAGTQLPLPRNEMPTALAWHDGKLVIGSLKGRVCLARDTDNDGLADDWVPISDDVPAPYGIASNGQAIDVLAKYGLLRLTPTSVSGAPWSLQVVADGWGYTADYHDWAVGLVRDEQNNYLMALPCQQDDRSPSAARLRGTVQRMIPQTPTSTDPRRYRMETVAAGQRFPMGLALDQAGRLFATDNQGNYNPFNEVNHIQSGKRYGFINKLENKAGFNPPLESPAVNLPHPWTRSVNGICFLTTPREMRGNPVFGPYEGHLIGCEYNGLSLIRMSLEEVKGQMQGAAYMFSRPVAADEPTFEGPVVCSVSPTGELVIGNIHDSGWGGGQNTGSIVSLKPTGQWPLGIAEVKALPTGLRINFTGKIDEQLASTVSSYTIRSYRRQSTPAYGGNDQEERQEPVLAAQVISGGTAVDLTLNPLRADSVYEVRVGKVAPGALFPDEAHYTMKNTP